MLFYVLLLLCYYLLLFYLLLFLFIICLFYVMFYTTVLLFFSILICIFLIFLDKSWVFHEPVLHSIRLHLRKHVWISRVWFWSAAVLGPHVCQQHCLSMSYMININKHVHNFTLASLNFCVSVRLNFKKQINTIMFNSNVLFYLFVLYW